jgi:hypothetical protein
MQRGFEGYWRYGDQEIPQKRHLYEGRRHICLMGRREGMQRELLGMQETRLTNPQNKAISRHDPYEESCVKT